MDENYHDSIYRMYLLGFSMSDAYVWKAKSSATAGLECLTAYALGKADWTNQLLKSKAGVMESVALMLGHNNG